MATKNASNAGAVQAMDVSIPASPVASSPAGILETLQDHIHSASKVYPTLAAAVTATGHDTAWTLGEFVEVVPVNTITSPFDIHFINAAAASAAGGNMTTA